MEKPTEFLVVIHRDSFSLTTGKSKTMGKKVCLGKARVGASSTDDCGLVHWKQVMTAKDVAWVMWHPIYGNK